MTPTSEQKQWLKNYLRKVMLYRETYEEVYDHMLLSMEEHPEKKYFATLVMDIVENDFGGVNGLVELEENCRQSVEVTAQSQFIDYFKNWFASPLIIITAAMSAILFYLQLPNVETHGALIKLFVALLLLPIVICSARAMQLGYQFGEIKTSIKDDIFRRLAFVSNRLLLKIFISSAIVQWVIKGLFLLNDYWGMAIGTLLVIILILPVIKRYRANSDIKNKVKVLPFSRDLFSMRLFIFMLISSLIETYMFKHNPAGSGKPIPIEGMYILYGLGTTVLVLMIINLLAVFKLYRTEIKTNMVTS